MDNSSLGTSFDFNSQAGVMAVLAAIRQSPLTGAQKNELRDLVFLYTNGGGDASVRLSLEQKIATYQIKPVAPVAVVTPVTTPAEPEVVLPFGSSRPAPTFVAPSVTTSPTPAPAPTSTPAPQPEPAKAVVPEPVAATPIPLVDLPVSVAPAPEVVDVPEVPRPVPVAAPAPVAIKTPGAQETASPAAFSDVNTNYLDRIREIKTAVNSKVGNPVNLVDIDNAVGREYMNALLDAMKRLSGGVGQINPAMQRLETAYQAVEVAVAAHQKTGAAETSVPTPVPAPVEPAPARVPEPQAAPLLVTVIPKQPEPANIPPLPVEEVIKPKLDDVPLVRENDSRWNSPAAEEAVPQVVPAPIAQAATPSFTSAATSVPQTPLSGVPAATVAPVAQAAPIHTPEDLPTAAMKAGKDADPLFAKDVDDGLEQLLSDWILFKKSGLFGTGPKGREHPLFVKMAALPIPLLLAGRFEGSTQEIKQSITDYMNGWRYEQGIIYEQGETFEHYLRRVIKQILDLQKKQRAS